MRGGGERGVAVGPFKTPQALRFSVQNLKQGAHKYYNTVN